MAGDVFLYCMLGMRSRLGAGKPGWEPPNTIYVLAAPLRMRGQTLPFCDLQRATVAITLILYPGWASLYGF